MQVQTSWWKRQRFQACKHLYLQRIKSAKFCGGTWRLKLEKWVYTKSLRALDKRSYCLSGIQLGSHWKFWSRGIIRWKKSSQPCGKHQWAMNPGIELEDSPLSPWDLWSSPLALLSSRAKQRALPTKWRLGCKAQPVGLLWFLTFEAYQHKSQRITSHREWNGTYHEWQHWRCTIQGVLLRIRWVASNRNLLELAQAKAEGELITIIKGVSLDRTGLRHKLESGTWTI